jgi:nicotinic acid mononucleotide adenylyltransferase
MAYEIRHSSRYHAAVAALDNTAALARLAHAAAMVTASIQPSALALAGGQRLPSARRVGVFAGSFNPLTRSHVALVNTALRSASLDVVIWTCAAVSVDKERVERAALVDRLAQMRAFLAGRRGDALALLNRGLYVDEARTLRALLAPTVELTLLVGYDKVVQIFDPRYYADRDAALRELFALARLLVAPRGDDGSAALAALLALPENRPFAAHVNYLDVPPHWLRDSSTEARALATESPPDERALARLLPPAGLALALSTGAFRPGADDATDAYAVRSRWLHALATIPQATARSLPPLSALTRATRREDASGRRLRAWLAGTTRDGNALLGLLANQAGQASE